MSLPSMRRLEKACRHGLRAGGTIYVGTLPINRTRDADSSPYRPVSARPFQPGVALPSWNALRGMSSRMLATVTVDIGADYVDWSFRSAACILRSTVRMVSNSSTETSDVAMS